ncbi:MAG: IS21/IS408/IS1162 family transposase, partial [Acidimicrobiales bacterium]
GFIMVLAYSRLLFLHPVLRMDEQSWVESHVLAFEFFSGAVRRIVPDNLKTGVIKPDLYDPLINRSFGEFAAHYGCLVDPARQGKARDKGRVERPVPYARDSFFAGRAEEFDSLAHLQDDALRWCREVANRRQHRGLDRVAPQVLFDAEEATALLPLPVSPFELARWSTPKVPPDIHVKVGRALYSVPWRHIGHTVDARESARTVEIYVEGTLVATHARVERGKQTNYDHYPPEKIAFMMRTPAWCRRRAAELGEAVAQVVEVLMEVNALYRLRQAQGVVGLADRHGADRLDAACRKALAVGDPSYRTVKGILVAGTEADHDEGPQAPPAAPAHLHGPQRLFCLEAAR